MPNYGVGALGETWLRRWEAAQQARYQAWTSAPTLVGGVIAVAETVGTLVGGSGTSFSAVQRWNQPGPQAGIRFR